MSGFYYGIDVGGTKIEIAVYNDLWQQLVSWRQPTPANDYSAFSECIRSLVTRADQQFATRGSVGIGFPGIIHPDGSLHAANLPGLDGKNVREDLSWVLNRSVIIDNDSRCFTRSEMAPGGAAEGCRDVFGAILGTGAGAGIALNGELVRGAQGSAGEWGHLPISAELQQRYSLPLLPCGCGLSGCVERYIAGPGLAQLYQEQGGPVQATVHQWLKALHEEDPIAQRTHVIHMDILGYALSNVTKLFSPDIIVLGGGLSNISEIVERVPEFIARHHFPAAPVCKVVRARLSDSSGVRGAALLGQIVLDRA